MLGGGVKASQVMCLPRKRKSSSFKDSQMTIRVNCRIKEAAVEFAHSMGLDVSEWLRSLVASELKRAGRLPASNDPAEDDHG